MTPADIIRLAELADYPLLEFDGKKHVHAALLRMFKMVVSEEREACAKVCDLETALWEENSDGQVSLRSVAAVIRARGKA